jgi:hypothetical protein
MKALGNFPARKLIHQWLKSGYSPRILVRGRSRQNQRL